MNTKREIEYVKLIGYLQGVLQGLYLRSDTSNDAELILEQATNYSDEVMTKLHSEEMKSE